MVFGSEAALVAAFARSVADRGIATEAGVALDAFVAGHEIALARASVRSNIGAADLLLVTSDGRWWLVEAKLARNAECDPHYLFGNQLARYADSIERLGLTGLHARLESYLYGRRTALQPPESLLADI
jgi:hypothetical protein